RRSRMAQTLVGAAIVSFRDHRTKVCATLEAACFSGAASLVVEIERSENTKERALVILVLVLRRYGYHVKEVAVSEHRSIDCHILRLAGNLRNVIQRYRKAFTSSQRL